LKAVLMKALSRDREDRYMTIDEMQRDMLSACEKCRIQWNLRLDNFEGLSIQRIPIEDTNFMASESTMMVSTASKRGRPANRKSSLRYLASLAIVIVLAAGVLAYYSKSEKEDRQLPHQAQAVVADGVPKEEGPAAAPPANQPEAPKPKSTAEQSDIPKPQVSTKQKDIPDSEPPVRTRAVPPQPVQYAPPNPCPSELVGETISVMVVVGESGDTIQCRVVSRGLSRELENFVRDFTLNNVKWAPAIANDGLPIKTSEFQCLLHF